MRTIFSSLSRWMSRSPLRRWTGIAACLSLVVLGFALAARPWLFQPPDAATAPLEQLVPFLASDRFASLDSIQRQQFLENLATRYVHLDRRQRDEFERLWKQNEVSPSLRRPLEQQMGLAVALQVVRHWRQLPPRERERYLDQVAAARRTIRLPMPFVDFWLSGPQAPAAEMVRNEQTMSHQLSVLKRQLFAHTTAPERVAMTEVGRGLLQREQRRPDR